MFNEENISHDLLEQIKHHVTRFTHNLLGDSAIPALPSPANTAPLLEKVRLLVNVANGKIPGDMADELFLQDVDEAIQLICQVLFAAPGIPRHYTIPASFWQTELGQVIQHCQIWQRGDDLITYTEAAEILWPDRDVQVARMRIKRMVERGELSGYTDPHTTNPQHAARVSRQEVEDYSKNREG